MREAPSLVIAACFVAEGVEVRAWDPVADARQLLPESIVDATVLDAVRGADAAVIVTEWPELTELASPEVREAMRTPLIVDGRNLLDPDAARAPGSRTRAWGGPRLPSWSVRGVMEAIILAGGKAERLGDAAGGRPKALVHVARAATRLVPGRLPASRGRRAGHRQLRGRLGGEVFESELADLGAEIVAVEEPSRSGAAAASDSRRGAQGDGRRLRSQRRRADSMLDFAALSSPTTRRRGPRRRSRLLDRDRGSQSSSSARVMPSSDSTRARAYPTG